MILVRLKTPLDTVGGVQTSHSMGKADTKHILLSVTFIMRHVLVESGGTKQSNSCLCISSGRAGLTNDYDCHFGAWVFVTQHQGKSRRNLQFT